jgi:hypothetical protein
MKKLTFLALILSFGLSVSASELRLRIFDNDNFSVQFDANKYESIGSEITIRKIVGGSHYLKVTQTKVFYTNGKKFTSREVIFDTYVYIKQSSVIFAIINENREFFVTEDRPIAQNNQNNHPNNHGNNDHHNPNNSGNNNNNQNGDYYNNNNNNNNQNNNNSGHGHGNTNVVKKGMNNEEMRLLLISIRNASFDEAKVTIAKDATRSNGIFSAQVLDILKELSFDNSRLDFAKFAYDFTVDPESYFMVNNGFSFDNSKIELSKYINEHKR